VSKEFMSRLLEVARDAAPEVEAAVSGVKDAGLRAAIAGAIMHRNLEVAPLGGAQSGNLAQELGGGSNELLGKGRAGGTQGRILDLRSGGFFSEPRRLEQVIEELQVRGYHHNKADVRMSLLRLARKRLLRRITFGQGRQQTFLYVNT
jgi:hypothetical protein